MKETFDVRHMGPDISHIHVEHVSDIKPPNSSTIPIVGYRTSEELFNEQISLLSSAA